MAGKRQDLAKLGPEWNDTILWYAKAVAKLDELAIDNRTSWRFLAAIHGFDEQSWRDAQLFRPGEATPDDLVNRTYGDQCQHGTWYFPPWHRGYLAAFEAIVAAKIKEMNGPDDWALPYWNYLDTTNPEARLPDRSPNPLNKPPRRNTDVLSPVFPGMPDIDLGAMAEPDFLVGNDGTIGFGGGITNFSRSGRRAGDLEANPHNPVHVMIGGLEGGYMSDPNFAGLDPIFWLHHCNIDRLWEAWMNAPERAMVRDPRWLDGPAERRFMMPRPDGSKMEFRPRETLKGGSLHPTYDDLVAGTGLAAAPVAVAGVSMGSTRTQQVAVLGASDESVDVGESPAATTVRLDPGPAAAAVQAMGPIEAGKEVTRLYLQLENVTGVAPSAVIDVFVNLPSGAAHADRSKYRAGSLYLFGLEKASNPDGPHAGNGLGFTLDITSLATRLKESGEFDPQKLDVLIVPAGGSTAGSPVKVGRISVLERRVRARD